MSIRTVIGSAWFACQLNTPGRHGVASTAPHCFFGAEVAVKFSASVATASVPGTHVARGS